MPKRRDLGYEGQRKAIFDGGSADRAVRGEKRFREERGHRVLTRLKPRLCDTGAADPNAPCGTSTAAPVFVDRRLLQLIALCSLQILDWSFDVCVIGFVCFLHISAFICMFLTFSVISFRARRRWHSANC